MDRSQEPKISTVLSALAESVRLRLLLVLEQEELLVGELANVVQLPQSTTSRHLKVLADAGLLKRRQAGPATLFKLVLDDLAPETRALWLAVRGQSGELSEDDRQRLGAKEVQAGYLNVGIMTTQKPGARPTAGVKHGRARCQRRSQPLPHFAVGALGIGRIDGLLDVVLFLPGEHVTLTSPCSSTPR